MLHSQRRGKLSLPADIYYSWKMKNFSVSYCYQFMMMLQGRIPVRVRLFLIVNRTLWHMR